MKNHEVKEKEMSDCDKCAKNFQCGIAGDCSPTGIYVPEDFAEERNLTPLIMSKLEEGNILYKHKEYPEEIYTVYRVEEDLTFFNHQHLEKGDYIVALWDGKKIRPIDLEGKSGLEIEEKYIKI